MSKICYFKYIYIYIYIYIYFFFFAVVFPFLKHVLQNFSEILLWAGGTKRGKAAQFIANAAKEVIQLRKQTGASQVLVDSRVTNGQCAQHVEVGWRSG